MTDLDSATMLCRTDRQRMEDHRTDKNDMTSSEQWRVKDPDDQHGRCQTMQSAEEQNQVCTRWRACTRKMQKTESSKCLLSVFFVRVGHERRRHRIRSSDQTYYLA
jgi:hypothetical protein